MPSAPRSMTSWSHCSASAISSICCSMSPTPSSRSSIHANSFVRSRPRCGAAAAPTSRRSALFDAEAGVLRHHVCDAPDDFCRVRRAAKRRPSTLDGSASGIVFKTGKPRVFPLADLDVLPGERVHPGAWYPVGLLGPARDGARRPRHAEPRGVRDDAFSADQFPLLTRVAGQIAIAVRNAVLVRAHRGAERAARAREAVPRGRDSQRAPVRGDHRPQPRARPGAAGDPDRGANRFDGAHLRRDRIGQGARRPRDPPAERATRAAPSSS